MVYGSISTQKPRATHLFSSSLPRNKPEMTHQTSHAHATRFAHSDFNRFFLCTTFAGKLQTYPKIAYCLQFACKYTLKSHFACSTYCKYASKLHDTCGIPANMPQNCTLSAGVQQVCYKNTYHLQGFCKYVTKLHFACRNSSKHVTKMRIVCRTSCKRCAKRKDVGRD